jgi:tetratricopeptide (TPR) repeat protein
MSVTSTSNNIEAEKYYVKALDIRKKVESNDRFPFCYMNYGRLLIKLNRLQKAKGFIDESVNISRSSNNEIYHTRSLIVLGKWYLNKKMYSEAISLYTEAEQLANHYEFTDELLAIIADLSTCFFKIDNDKMYHQYTRELYQLFIQKGD